MAGTKFLLSCSMLLGLFSASAEAGYYKCVDKNGQVQYYTVKPPVCVSQGSVTKDPHSDPHPQPQTAKEETAEQIEQKRHDRALLGTYTNEDEIDLALKRNLQAVDARINSIQVQVQAEQDDLDRFAKEKADLESAGKQVDKGLMDDISEANSRMSRLQNDLTQAQSESEAIKTRFAADKKRFRELTGDKQ